MDDDTNESEAPVSTTAVDKATLNTMDRCDRCGAQAYMRVTLGSGGELLFCAHHGRAHQDKLQQVAITIQDETSKLD